MIQFLLPQVKQSTTYHRLEGGNLNNTVELLSEKSRQNKATIIMTNTNSLNI